MARKIVVTSGKGGVGKTTLSVQLSAQLAAKGQRVVLCDADFGLNNVDVEAGVEHLVGYDIVDVIEGRCRAKQALVKHPKYPNLHVLTSSHAAPERYLSPQAVKVVLESISPQFDYIIIDCPAGIDDGFHRAVATADEAIVVTTPTLPSLRDADKVITMLKSYQLSSLTVVINRVQGELLATGDCLTPKEIANLLKVPILGLIPDEPSIGNGDLGKIHPAIQTLASNLTTGKVKMYDVTKKYVGFFGSIRRVLKKVL